MKHYPPLFILFFVVYSSSTSALVIDDFSGINIIIKENVTNADFGPSGNSVGDPIFDRTIDVETNSDFGFSINQFVFADYSLYTQNQGPGNFAQSTVTYHLGGIDLSDGANAFRFQIYAIDMWGFVHFDVDGVVVTVETTDIIMENDMILPSYMDILFSDFPGVDFSNVQQISFAVDGLTRWGLDSAFDNLETVCSELETSGGSGEDPSELNTCSNSTLPETPAGSGEFGRFNLKEIQ